MAQIEILQTDITRLEVGAIVNAANSSLQTPRRCQQLERIIFTCFSEHTEHALIKASVHHAL